MATSIQFANEVLDRSLGGDLFLSLHSKDPGETGVGELVGAGYERKHCSDALAKAAGKIKTNAADIEMKDLPKGSVTHVGLWSKQFGGDYKISGKLADEGRDIKYEGDGIRFRAGRLAFSFE